MSGALQDIESCAVSRIYPVYWDEFHKRVDEYQSEVKFNSARRHPSTGWIRLVSTGIGGVFFSAVASVDKRRVEADFTIENDAMSMEIFQEMERHKHDIEARFGRRLEWQPCTSRKYRIFSRKSNADLRDRSQWPEQHDWLIRNVGKLFLAIRPRYEQFRQ